MTLQTVGVSNFRSSSRSAGGTATKAGMASLDWGEGDRGILRRRGAKTKRKARGANDAADAKNKAAAPDAFPDARGGASHELDLRHPLAGRRRGHPRLA